MSSVIKISLGRSIIRVGGQVLGSTAGVIFFSTGNGIFNVWKSLMRNE